MPRPARIPRRYDAAVGAGAAIHPLLKTPHDKGLVRRAAYRFNFSDTIRLWGFELKVPAHRMAPHWLWQVRTQSYEQDEASALLCCIDRRLPFVEFGGGFGAVSVLVNRHALDHPEQHVVIEMDPEMVEYLVRNGDQNNACYEVIHAAVSDRPVQMDPRQDFIGQQATAAGTVVVPNITPLEVLARRGWDRVNVFMDIEGMEVELLDAFSEFFRDHVEVLVLETHGHKTDTDRIARLPNQLLALGLEPIWTRNRVWAYRRKVE